MTLIGLDTNILIYAADNAGDGEKHAIALDLLGHVSRSRRGVLAVQALSEFYVVAVRKAGLPEDLVASYVEAWGEAFPVVSADFADVSNAMRAHRNHRISFWDGMMWSVLRRAGVQTLLSEDLQDGRDLEGVLIVNPFDPANAEKLTDILGE